MGVARGEAYQDYVAIEDSSNREMRVIAKMVCKRAEEVEKPVSKAAAHSQHTWTYLFEGNKTGPLSSRDLLWYLGRLIKESHSTLR